MYAADTRVTELGHRLDLGYAQGIGEDYVRVHGNPAMVDPDAGWRRAPASLQQRNKLRALRIPFGEEITKGAASDLISAASAAAQLERAS